MAKVNNITVGIVSKVMKHIGYSLFLSDGTLFHPKVFDSYAEAKRLVDNLRVTLEVKPVYVEEN